MSTLGEWMARRDRVLVMGILNVTPDSFHDGARYGTADLAIERGLALAAEGADIVDVGGESTRPGADPLSPVEEADRVLPVIEALAKESDVPLSIDTTKASVARAAIEAGAVMVNDVSALRFDDEMAETIGRAGSYVTLMHMQGTPSTMQENPTYENVVEEVRGFLADRVRVAAAAGIPPERIFVDPGIGFGKRLRHNLALLRGLRRLTELGRPVVCGLSRKSFLGAILDVPSEDRLEGTVAANAIAIANGADVIRVHDVKEGRRTADVAIRLRPDGS
jgi:dihydropteroate synthase